MLALEGALVRARAPRLLAAGAAQLVVRPEDVGIARDDGAAGAAATVPAAAEGEALIGRVLRRQYLGSRTSYKVALADDLTIAVDLTGESHDAFAAGRQKEIALVYPSDRTFTSAEYLTLVKVAPAGDLAKKVCDLPVSREVQVALLESAFRRPIHVPFDPARNCDTIRGRCSSRGRAGGASCRRPESRSKG